MKKSKFTEAQIGRQKRSKLYFRLLLGLEKS